MAKLNKLADPEIYDDDTRITGPLEENLSEVFISAVATSDQSRHRARRPRGPWRRGLYVCRRAGSAAGRK